MPVAICYYQNGLNLSGADTIASVFAEKLQIKTEDIHLNFIESHQQAGRPYKLLIQLLLPSLWTSDQVKEIQQTLLECIRQHLQLPVEQIFMITRIVESGHVMEDGLIQHW